MGPVAFLRAHRLSRARQLLKDRAVASVTEAALHSGFTELGRFAAYYHGMFGELPSRTLAENA